LINGFNAHCLELDDGQRFAMIHLGASIISAIKAAADEKGIDAPVAQGGSNISGGQKQRLQIARAIVKKPELYIFDDSFSALDFKTDALLRRRLKEECAEAITLIVAQRISTIMHADQILVLHEGNVIGQGTHEQLLQTCPTYKQIADLQLQIGGESA